jgi:hypothetical protein
MKLLLLGLFIALTINLQAQKAITDSIPGFTLKELNLTPEQKIAIKKLIWEYKLEDRRRRRELRHRIFMNLNVNQQMAVRRWWRRQLRHWH